MPPWLARLLGLSEALEIAPELHGGRLNPVVLQAVIAEGRRQNPPMRTNEVGYAQGKGIPASYGEPPTLPAIRAQGPGRPPDAQALLDRRGVLPQQRGFGWQEDFSRRVFNAAEPIGLDYLHRWGPGEVIEVIKKVTDENTPPREPHPGNQASEDAWAMYLGLPQPFGHFDISEHRPSRSSEAGPYYSLPSLWDDLIDFYGTRPSEEEVGVYVMDETEAIRKMLYHIQRGGGRTLGDAPPSDRNEDIKPSFALGDFTLGQGVDEEGRHYISLYDIWDLDKIPGNQLLGEPFEVYDRLYYDPKTFRPLPR